MTINITSRASAAVPSSASEVTLFMDSGNNNALTAKYSNSTFKVLSDQPVQFTVSEPLTDALNDKLDHLTCAAAKGVITMAELQTYMDSINLYYTSNIDANGNLNQSITTSPVSGSSDDNDFTVDFFAETTSTSDAFDISYSTGVSDTIQSLLSVDRNGLEGDIAVSATFPVGTPGITFSGESYTIDSLGAATTHTSIIAEGASLFDFTIDYDGTATTPGTYTGVITLTSGLVSKYIAVRIVVS